MPPVIRATNVGVYDPPVVAPSPLGLYQHVQWQENGDPARFLLEGGKVIRPVNYVHASGKWTQELCDTDVPDADIKEWERPDFDEDHPFTHEVLWAADKNYPGDLHADEQARVVAQAERNLEMHEQTEAELSLAERLLADITAQSIPVTTVGSLKEAVGVLEDAIALTRLPGFIHARPFWASQEYGMVSAIAPYTSPLGNQWVFGAGYIEGLENTLVATSQVFGWRSSLFVERAIEHQRNEFVAVAERSVLLGYEKIIAAVEIS